MSLIPLGILAASGAGAVSVAGYAAGGETSSSKVTTVDKFAFPSDSRSTLATGLSSARSQATGFQNEAL